MPTMTSLSHDDVRHIAKLARLNLSDDEVAKFSTELTDILQYLGKLAEVDTTNVEPTAQVTGLTNSFRADELSKSHVTTEQLLECSALPITQNQIETPSAHG